MESKSAKTIKAEDTKRETIEYVIEAYRSGKRFSDISRDKLPKTGVWLRNGVLRNFGNIIDMCKELGMPEEEFVSSRALTRYYSMKLTKADVDRYITTTHKEGRRGMTAKEVMSTEGNNYMVTAARREYGSWDMALYENGVMPRRIVDNEVIERITGRVVETYREVETIQGTSKKLGISDSLVRSILKEQGEEIIHKTDWFNNRVPPLPKDEVVEFVRELVRESENTKIDTRDVREKYPLEYFSIVKHYGNLSTAIMESGEYVLDKQVPRKWNRGYLKEQIMLGSILGKSLNHTHMHVGAGATVIAYAREEFGTWKKAIEWAGLDYEKVSLKSTTNADLGREFESVLDDIFTEIGLDYSKENHVTYKPDYVVGSEWIDAKLSEFTHAGKDRDGRTVVDKYEQHCDKLTLVFLLGNENTDRMLTDKTRLVHVSKYVGMLSDDKQAYYRRRLGDIKDRADGRKEGATA